MQNNWKKYLGPLICLALPVFVSGAIYGQPEAVPETLNDSHQIDADQREAKLEVIKPGSNEKPKTPITSDTDLHVVGAGPLPALKPGQREAKLEVIKPSSNEKPKAPMNFGAELHVVGAGPLPALKPGQREAKLEVIKPGSNEKPKAPVVHRPVKRSSSQRK